MVVCFDEEIFVGFMHIAHPPKFVEILSLVKYMQQLREESYERNARKVVINMFWINRFLCCLEFIKLKLEFQTRLTPSHPVNKTNQTNQIIRIHNGLPDLTWFHWSLSRAAFRDIILERALNR